MTASSGHDREFVAYLASLVGISAASEVRKQTRKNLAALAALRRGLGKRPGEAAEMFPYVVPYLPDHPSRRHDDYFLVASLFATHPRMWLHSEDSHTQTNLGASFRWLRAIVDNGSIEKRFIALLSAEREHLAEQLRHAVSLLKTSNIPIDWLQLLFDLHRWEEESRSVQGAWARAYWRVNLSQSQQAVQATSYPVPGDSDLRLHDER